MQQALEALDAICDELIEDDPYSAAQIARHAGSAARTTLRAALAEQPAQQEPVAWKVGRFLYGHYDAIPSYLLPPQQHPQPLYTTPPAPQPVFCECGDEIVADDGARCGTCVATKTPQPLTTEDINAAWESAVRDLFSPRHAFARAVEREMLRRMGVRDE